MIRVRATRYDGASSARQPVWIVFDPAGRVRVEGSEVAIDAPWADIRISDRLGDTPRFVRLPDGSTCEARDNASIDAAIASLGGYEGSRLVHVLEHRWRFVLVAVLATALFTWVLIEHGVPAAARVVASQIPDSVEDSMGAQTLEAMDSGLVEPSALDDETRARVETLLARAVSVDPSVRVRLELRASELFGANAFALPGGIVLVTDDLVEIVESDEELLAVIAHEVGHVHHRHLMRTILQDSMTALAVRGGGRGPELAHQPLRRRSPRSCVEAHYSRRHSSSRRTRSPRRRARRECRMPALVPSRTCSCRHRRPVRGRRATTCSTICRPTPRTTSASRHSAVTDMEVRAECRFRSSRARVRLAREAQALHRPGPRPDQPKLILASRLVRESALLSASSRLIRPSL